MEEKDKVTLTSIIKNTVASFGGLIGDLSKLVLTEAHLAGRSVVSLMFLYLFMGVLLLTTWFCLQAVLIVFLVSLSLSWLLSLIIVTLFNAIVMFALWLFIHKTKQNLYFKASRRQLVRLKNLMKN